MHLQGQAEQLQRDLADAEEGEPLLPMRESFYVPSLPTFSVRPLEDSMVGLGLCPIPRMAQHHLSQWCPPIRGVDCSNLWGLLNLPILHLLQFCLRPAAVVSSVCHMTLLSPFQRGPWPCSLPTILNLLPPPQHIRKAVQGWGSLESGRKQRKMAGKESKADTGRDQ